MNLPVGPVQEKAAFIEETDIKKELRILYGWNLTFLKMIWTLDRLISNTDTSSLASSIISFSISRFLLVPSRFLEFFCWPYNVLPTNMFIVMLFIEYLSSFIAKWYIPFPQWNKQLVFKFSKTHLNKLSTNASKYDICNGIH